MNRKNGSKIGFLGPFSFFGLFFSYFLGEAETDIFPFIFPISGWRPENPVLAACFLHVEIQIHSCFPNVQEDPDVSSKRAQPLQTPSEQSVTKGQSEDQTAFGGWNLTCATPVVMWRTPCRSKV